LREVNPPGPANKYHKGHGAQEIGGYNNEDI